MKFSSLRLEENNFLLYKEMYKVLEKCQKPERLCGAQKGKRIF